MAEPFDGLETPAADPRLSAQLAGLRYVSQRTTGFTRRRSGKGFLYLDLKGQRVCDPALKKRFRALMIPPAWENVWICRYANGHIQATGRDEKGRKQYIYHPEWDKVRNQTKFNRMLAFANALPNLRQQVEQDLRLAGFPRRKVLAILASLLEKTLIRIGNPEYARSNQSYGLTTLENEHIAVNGARLVFSFRGKSGKQHEIELHDKRLAQRVARMQELPGQRLFQYLDESGRTQAVHSEDVNEYLRQLCGEQFTAKDFRTWGGTTLAALELYAAGPAANVTQQKRVLAGVVRQVAAVLGNTPAICRNYYIHPDIVEAYQDGSLFDAMQQAFEATAEQAGELRPEERAVHAILAAEHSTEKGN